MTAKKQTPQQQIIEDFANTWEERTGSRYYIDWGKDIRWAIRLIEMNMDADDYIARKNAFFNEPRWWEYGRWGFATFVNNINKCVPEPPKQAAPRKVNKCAIHKLEHAGPFCPKCYVEEK